MTAAICHILICLVFHWTKWTPFQ